MSKNKTPYEVFLTLKNSDLSDIKSQAQDLYLKNAPDPRNPDMFLCKCYAEAVCGILTSKGFKLTDERSDLEG